MFDELKKDLSSLKLLSVLITFAVSIYLLQFVFEFLRNFSDIILILFFGWLVSFILEPFVDIFTNYLKVPRAVSTVLVFLLSGVLISLTFILFIPDIISQFRALEKVIPAFLGSAPAPLQRGVDSFIGSLNNYTDFIPSITQFLVNLVTVLILSFYLVIDKDNIGRRVFAITPKKYHDEIRFIDRVIDKSFASFVRIQLMWGVLGGLITWIVLSIFGVNFAASTSLLAGILTAVPVIGPIIGVLPPLLVSVIEKPANEAIIIFLIIFGLQQFIFNVLGPKLIGRAFNLNPVIVILSLLIGIKIAGATGAIFAIPVISIILIIGREFYNYHFKERES
ncbi:MAG: AI-2E family transporter [Candidatus Levybacteria bacterium]|nr:AI-2E family transporter [Candidatus Levybacteria bacterium]